MGAIPFGSREQVGGDEQGMIERNGRVGSSRAEGVRGRGGERREKWTAQSSLVLVPDNYSLSLMGHSLSSRCG